MTDQEYIGLINLVNGVMATPLIWIYARWVWRDGKSLMRISAGMLVIVFLVALCFRGYESFYYGAARLLHIEGVNLWRDEPWTTWVAIVRTGGLLLLIGAYAAKVRADGHAWRTVLRKSMVFTLTTVAVAVVIYAMLVA